MPSSFQLLASGLVGALGCYVLIQQITGRRAPRSPIQLLPGPPSASMFFGNSLQILKSEDQVELHRQWVKKYGPTIVYKGIFWPGGRIYTLDLKAINHILMNCYTYKKPDFITHSIRRVVGDGILFVEDDVHKKQRRVMNPAFGPMYLRELMPIFIEKAIRLRDIWIAQAKVNGGEARIDGLSWLCKTALDVIGEAGFGYDLEALSEDLGHENELSQAFSRIFRVGAGATLSTFIAILRGKFPILRFLPADGDEERMKARNIMFEIGRKLLQEQKREIAPSALVKSAHGLSKGKSLLSLLLRANTSDDVPDHQKLTDEEVVAREFPQMISANEHSIGVLLSVEIPTFILAGHETTGTATSWALYALTKNKDVQVKLREELLTVSSDNPSMDELNALPYLDGVVRETLRLHAPVSTNSRVATMDDVIPLERPVTDLNGEMHHSLRVSKGQNIAIPIVLINTSEEIWGEDALEFNPSRWASVPPTARNVPGIWGNIMSFSGGPRGCIGYRFSLLEIKALLFTLIRAFDLDLAVPPSDILQKPEVVTRPVLKTDPNHSNQLPLIVRPLEL
ncbi:hypothetical protein NP233_g2500 [Leucocoprinus birnbaumii]|uniref:Cytochrome P450 n=1 Tax=Leucocoprinus birnbaumii TaxID=56174 RepID=A0AAD5YUT8_9AGAR|nr:hypothetical protein NP233_g2500 [Leucocoprinus birnbaumii]